MEKDAQSQAVAPDPGFCRQVEAALGQQLGACFHCGKCASGCPVGFAMDLLPNQVVRQVQLGLKDQVLQSAAIWLCASCQTCTTRCPNEVDIAALMDLLREMARREGVPAAEEQIPLFHAAFLASVEKRGRVHELGMLARYRLQTRKEGGLLADAGLGWEMFKRGKLKLLPAGIRQREQIRELFRRSKS
jgi:heterodisulfide reductase subunit C